jgi:hypothetical protein
MVPVVPVPFPEKGNDLYPLPPDYYELDVRGQRLARVNASRQWLLWNHPTEKVLKARAYVASVWFFDDYYLTREMADDGTIAYEPSFYRNKLTTPNFHWGWREHIITARHFAGVGPRGSAKTFFHALNIIHWMVSCPMYDITYATSTNLLAEEMGDRCKFQVYNNPRLNDDFAPEYSARSLKPKKSEGKMGMSSFRLSNRSGFFATSAESRQRGLRPVKYILDDPEWDPNNPEAVTRNVEKAEDLIFKIALPMVQQSGASLIWTGTFISLRHFLWQALSSDILTLPDGREVEVAAIKQFRRWTRIISPVEQVIDGKRVSCWPEMWPADNEEKTRLDLPEDTQTLADIEEDIGTDRYNTEFRCKPGLSKGAFFPVLEYVRHGWMLHNPDDRFETDPLTSNARVNYTFTDKDKVEDRNLAISDFLLKCPRFLLCDSTWSDTALSDWRTIIVAALSPQNDLFLLDGWAEKCKEDRHVEHLFLYAQKWKAMSIAVEHITSGKSLADRLLSIVKNRSLDIGGVTHWPAIRPFNPGLTDKQTKISRIHWRFRFNRVKLPWHLKDTHPWPMLWQQIANFHPQLVDGGLAKDDMLDTLSMAQYVAHGRPVEEEDKKVISHTVIDQIKQGKLFDDTGHPLLMTAVQCCTPEQLSELITFVRHKQAPKPEGISI